MLRFLALCYLVATSLLTLIGAFVAGGFVISRGEVFGFLGHFVGGSLPLAGLPFFLAVVGIFAAYPFLLYRGNKAAWRAYVQRRHGTAFALGTLCAAVSLPWLAVGFSLYAV